MWARACGGQRRCLMPWSHRQLWATIQMLRTESSARAVRAFKCWTISSVPQAPSGERTCCSKLSHPGGLRIRQSQIGEPKFNLPLFQDERQPEEEAVERRAWYWHIEQEEQQETWPRQWRRQGKMASLLSGIKPQQLRIPLQSDCSKAEVSERMCPLFAMRLTAIEQRLLAVHSLIPLEGWLTLSRRIWQDKSRVTHTDFPAMVASNTPDALGRHLQC